MALAFGGRLAAAEEFSADFGTAEDFNAERPIYFPKDKNYWLWGMEKPAEYIQYENEKEFYWATVPRKPEKYVGARVLKSHHVARLHAKMIPGATTLRLAIRYKDNLLSPVTVWALGKDDEKSKIGELGGKFDHQWKTEVLAVSVGALSVEDGTVAFQIGNKDYGDLTGDLPIDSVGFADTTLAAEPPQAGYWPKQPPSKFADIGKTLVYEPGDKPTFVAGVMTKSMRVGTWKEFAAAGCNHIDLQAWEFNWSRQWDIYADENYSDRVRFGFPDWNDACKDAGVGCSVQFFTDTRAWWIQNDYHGEAEVIDKIGQVVQMNKTTKANRVWYPVDEPDHDDVTWGAPLEFTMAVSQRIRREDPDTPIFINFQAWKPGIFKLYEEAYDVAAFDVYPLGVGRSPLEIVNRMEAMNRQLGDRKGKWAIVEAHEGDHVNRFGRQLTHQETLVQAYLAITHGAQGILYFVDKEGRYIDTTEMSEPWLGVKTFCSDITNEKTGIESFLVPPARTVDQMGEKGVVDTDNAAIHFLLKEKPNGERALIAVNARNALLTDVHITIKGLPADAVIERRFGPGAVRREGNDIIDDFNGYERHVYIIRPGGSAVTQTREKLKQGAGSATP
ncbi:MAG: hypothetical protein H6685_03815 [Deltaproteobacteria bacterium]|nr:hypothetical protein [Deltaproteobacteria bacterium]